MFSSLPATYVFMVSLSGIGVMFFIGYAVSNLIPFVRTKSLKEKIVFSPFVFFVFIFIFHKANFYLDIPLYTHSWAIYFQLTGVVLISLLCSCKIRTVEISRVYHSIRQCSVNTHFIKAPGFILMIILAAGMIFHLLPFLKGWSPAGDVDVYLKSIKPFLEGSATSFPSYFQHSCLTFYTCSFFAKVFTLPAEQSFIVPIVIQNLLLSGGLYILVKKLTGNSWLGVLAAFLSLFYCGFYMGYKPWFFNVAVEAVKAPNHVNRMLAVSVLPFIFMAVLDYERSKKVFYLWLAFALTFISLGFHPYPFTFAFGFLVLYMFLSSLGQKTLSAFLYKFLFFFGIVFISAFLLTGGDLFPMFPQSVRKGQLLLHFDTYVRAYGLLALMAPLSIVFLRKEFGCTRFYMALFFSAIGIFLITYLKEAAFVFYPYKEIFHPAFHKYGHCIHVAIIILSMPMFLKVHEYVSGKSRNFKRVVLFMIGAVIFYSSTVVFGKYVERIPFGQFIDSSKQNRVQAEANGGKKSGTGRQEKIELSGVTVERNITIRVWNRRNKYFSMMASDNDQIFLVDQRGERAIYKLNLSTGSASDSIVSHEIDGDVRDIDFYNGYFWALVDEREIVKIDQESGRLLDRYNFEGFRASAFAFAEDSLFAIADNKKYPMTVVQYDINNQKLLQSFQIPGKGLDIVYNETDGFLYVNDVNKEIKKLPGILKIDPDSGRIVERYEIPFKIKGICFHNNHLMAYNVNSRNLVELSLNKNSGKSL